MWDRSTFKRETLNAAEVHGSRFELLGRNNVISTLGVYRSHPRGQVRVDSSRHLQMESFRAAWNYTLGRRGLLIYCLWTPRLKHYGPSSPITRKFQYFDYTDNVVLKTWIDQVELEVVQATIRYNSLDCNANTIILKLKLILTSEICPEESSYSCIDRREDEGQICSNPLATKPSINKIKNETRNNFCTPSEVAHIDRSPLDAQDDIHEKVLLEVLSQSPLYLLPMSKPTGNKPTDHRIIEPQMYKCRSPQVASLPKKFSQSPQLS